MEKHVMISLRGRQSFAGAEDEVVELVTEGILLQNGEKGYTIRYHEGETSGMEGTLTTLRIEGERVTLVRAGEFSSRMVFEEGRQHQSLYHTPYGALSVGIRTRRMDCSLGEHGGQVEIDYAMEIDHSLAGEHLFQLSVREKEPGLPR